MEQNHNNLFDLIRKTWEIYTTHFNFFLILVLLLAFPLNMVLDLTEAHSFMNDPSINSVQQNYYTGTLDIGFGDYKLIDYWGYFTERKMNDPLFWVNFAAQAISWFTEIIITVAIVLGVTRILKGSNKIEVKKIVADSVPYWWSIIATGFMMTVLLTPLFLALIVPGIIFMVFWIFYWIVVVVDHKRYWTALKYSRELVRGKWWEVFGRYIAVMVILVTIVLTISSASTTLMLQIPGAVGIVMTIIQIILLFASVFMVVYYHDLKERQIIVIREHNEK